MKAFGPAALGMVAAFLAQPIEGTAVLKGRVVDAITGKPLRGVGIRASYQPLLPYTPGIDARPPDRR